MKLALNFKSTTMVKSSTTPLLFFTLIIAIACGGDDDDDNKLRFEGLLATDDNNNSLGAIGTRDIDDWRTGRKDHEAARWAQTTRVKKLPAVKISGWIHFTMSRTTW